MGFSVRIGEVFDPSYQVRVYNDWKKAQITETRVSNTNMVIESRPI